MRHKKNEIAGFGELLQAGVEKRQREIQLSRLILIDINPQNIRSPTDSHDPTRLIGALFFDEEFPIFRQAVELLRDNLAQKFHRT